GNYAFTSLSPTAYVVREVLPAGVTQTKPSAANPFYSISVALGANVTGKDFGNKSTPGAPEISVSYGTVNVADGDTTPSTTEGTDFGSVAAGTAGPQRTFIV